MNSNKKISHDVFFQDILNIIPGTLISVIIMLFIRIRIFEKINNHILIFGIETAKYTSLYIIFMKFIVQFITLIISRYILLQIM